MRNHLLLLELSIDVVILVSFNNGFLAFDDVLSDQVEKKTWDTYDEEDGHWEHYYCGVDDVLAVETLERHLVGNVEFLSDLFAIEQAFFL
jgi:hypothetical protein